MFARVCVRENGRFCCSALFACAEKWKVNVGAIGLYLPPFLSPPATLTVQSQDNGGETNAVFRLPEQCTAWCVCVCVRKENV